MIQYETPLGPPKGKGIETNGSYSVQKGSSINDLHSSLVTLSNELQDLKLDQSIRSQFMIRVQLSETLREVISTNAIDGQPIPQAIAEELFILLERKASLTKSILTLKKDVSYMQKELDDLRARNLEFVRSNREMMQDINTSQTHEAATWTKVSQDPTVIKHTKKLQNINSCLSLYRNTLQGLILASGIDWAQDEHLLATMVDLGVPLNEKWRQP